MRPVMSHSFMTDMHYNMRAKMKEFSAMARSHVPGCFALLAHPFVAVSVMQPRSPMGPLGLHKLEEVHSVCVCFCVCAVHLPPGQITSVLQKTHDHVKCRNRL